MFTNRTVFVLGAGASAPYDFSTGAGLLDKARRQPKGGLVAATGGHISASDDALLLDQLDATMHPSIDLLLEHRDDLLEAGRSVIASLLLDEERNFRHWKRDSKNDWMAWLFSQMWAQTGSLDAFLKNQVSFVTFNYDRLLEHRFVRALASQYQLDVENCWQRFSSVIPVVHVHGSIGPLYPSRDGDGSKIIPFGFADKERDARCKRAAASAKQNIKIVHDADTTAFEPARDLLAKAQRVVFLGFGFGAENVERLKLAFLPKDAQVQVCTYDMKHQELLRNVHSAFPHHTTDCENGDIRPFLRARAMMVG